MDFSYSVWIDAWPLVEWAESASSRTGRAVGKGHDAELLDAVQATQTTTGITMGDDPREGLQVKQMHLGKRLVRRRFARYAVLRQDDAGRVARAQQPGDVRGASTGPRESILSEGSCDGFGGVGERPTLT